MIYRIYYYGTYSGVLQAWGLFYFWGNFYDKVFKTYDEQIVLYNFDARIRRMFFKYILLIEKINKNLIAYTFSQAHP